MDLIRAVNFFKGFCGWFGRSLVLLKKSSVLENSPIAASIMSCKIIVFARIRFAAFYFPVIRAAKIAKLKLSPQGSF